MKSIYEVIHTMFIALAWLFGGLAVVFTIYMEIVVNDLGEFIRAINNPLMMVHFLPPFIPAIICSWISEWAHSKTVHIRISKALYKKNRGV